MTTIQIINTILVLVLGPLVVACCAVLYLAIQRMPTAQRAALEQFARMAVRHVEQAHADEPNKKKLARAYTSDMFRLHRLPVPHADLIEVAVGAAFYETQGHG